MNGSPKVNATDIKNYVQRYFESIYLELVTIDVDSVKYTIKNINGSLNFGIYDFWNKTDEELLRDFDNYSFKGDYIGTIFFFLSGYWEYIHNDIKDRYRRFPAKESFAYKKGMLEEPVVDILADKIKNELGLHYKDERPKAFLTHDVDHLGLPRGLKFVKALGGDVLKRKDLKLAFDRIKRQISGSDPWSAYNLIELHKKYGTKGTFFFMPAVQPDEFPGGYDTIKVREYLEKLGKEIQSAGGTVGIHYDVRHLSENRMESDINRLNDVFETKIEYGRAHFLLFDITKSFEIYERAGIKYDTTCSFADAVGFRLGTSKPFKPYNFKEKREYNITEIPLIVMDGSLQNPRYMNLTPERGLEKIKELVDKIKKYNGTFTFLWHNSSFYTTEWKNWERVYDETIKYLKENGFEFV